MLTTPGRNMSLIGHEEYKRDGYPPNYMNQSLNAKNLP